MNDVSNINRWIGYRKTSGFGRGDLVGWRIWIGPVLIWRSHIGGSPVRVTWTGTPPK